MNRIKTKFRRFDNKANIPCPECGSLILFEERALHVKCEGSGFVPVKGFLQPAWPFMSVCNNPLCGWSKVIVG